MIITITDELRVAKAARAKAEAAVLTIEARIEAEATQTRTRMKEDPTVHEFARRLGELLALRSGGSLAVDVGRLIDRSIDILLLVKQVGVVL